MKKSPFYSIGFWLSAAIMGTICLGLIFELNRRGHEGVPVWTGITALFALGWLYLLLGSTGLNDWIGAVTKGRYRWRMFVITHMLLLPYLLYAWGTGSLEWPHVARLALFIFLATACLVFNRPSEQRLTLQDVAFILAIWLPIDFRLLTELWYWPEGHGASAYVNLTAVSLAVMLVVGFRGLKGVGFQFSLTIKDLPRIALNFSAFIAVALAIGLPTGFIQWTGHEFDAAKFALTFLGIFLMVALPEELLFRGILQNLLQKTLLSRMIAMSIASILFGLAHLNNGDHPDWRYVLLATIAGYVYGYTYNQCRTLMAAATVHALVDTVWVNFFR